MMHRDHIFDELRRIDREVVEAERVLAAQEAELVSLKKQNKDLTEVEAALEESRHAQQRRQQERQRLLQMVQP